MRPTARLTLAALALLATAAGPPPEAERMVPGGRAGFVHDGAGGCWLWAGGIGATATEITGSWTGNCPEGPAEDHGTGEIRWREGGQDRGMIYVGPLQRGKAEGEGRLAIMLGNEAVVIQEGRFRDDEFVGGRVEFPRADAVYEGGWRNGHPNGEGRLSIFGREWVGNWANGCLSVGRGVWMAITRPARDCEETAT